MTELETGDNWLDAYIPYQLYRVSHQLTERVRKKMRTLKVSTTEWRILSVLRAHGISSIGQIAELSMLEQPTISRVVAKLEAAGKVVRRSAESDTRITLVTLTPKGLELFTRLVEPALQHQERAFEGISAEDVMVLKATLARISDNMSHEN